MLGYFPQDSAGGLFNFRMLVFCSINNEMVLPIYAQRQSFRQQNRFKKEVEQYVLLSCSLVRYQSVRNGA